MRLVCEQDDLVEKYVIQTYDFQNRLFFEVEDPKNVGWVKILLDDNGELEDPNYGNTCFL